MHSLVYAFAGHTYHIVKQTHVPVQLLFVGMTPTSCERQVVLEPYIPDVEKMLVYDGTTGHINPHFYKKGSAVIPNLNRE